MAPPLQNNLHLLHEYCALESLDNYEDLIRLYATLQIEGKTALMFAAEKGALDLVQDLVTIGKASLDETNEDLDYDSDSEETGYLVQGKETGYTALMYACEQGHEAVVKFLIESCADGSLKNARNKTAQDLAKIAGHQHFLALFPEKKQEGFLPGKSSELMQRIAETLNSPCFFSYGAEKKQEVEIEMTVLKTKNHV